MHMGLSGLNAHSNNYHFINYSTCERCNARLENCRRYLFECPVHAADHLDIITLLLGLLPHNQKSILDLQLISNWK